MGMLLSFGAIGIAVAALLVFMFVLIPMMFRVVVPTNEVHIIQRGKTTEPYGKGAKSNDGSKENGNVYYKWPSWVMKWGVNSIVLPTSIFGIDLKDYVAYDKGKVPFQVDIKAFFKVDDANTVAQRVESFGNMKNQLTDILRGSVRTILAGADIEEIMEGRGQFGDMFTAEVREQLLAWGISTVKNIEFMDITDGPGSEVVSNIMAKNQAAIEKVSRQEVAGHKKEAQMTEIDAVKEADMRQQAADEAVGQREAEKTKAIGISNEQAKQDIAEQSRITAEKDMAVAKVSEEKRADIDKSVAETVAKQDKEITRLEAEALLIKQEREADGIKVAAGADLAKQEFEAKGVEVLAAADLTKQKLNAEGVLALGESTAESAKLLKMADVEPQITLAKEIGANERYMEYLLGTQGIAVGGEVGKAKATALLNADVKVISNAGDADSGMDKVMDMFSSKGGTHIGGMLEALAQTDVGKGLLEQFTKRKLNRKPINQNTAE